MTRLNDIPPGDSITACFFGPSGVGKTWCMGTAGDRTLYCNIEGRLATIQSKQFQSKFKFNPFIITVTEEPIPDGGAKALVELTKQINYYLENHKDEFDTIIVDGATALRRFAMNMGLELNQKTRKSQSLNNKKTFSPDFPAVDITVQDYAMEMSMIEKFITLMKECCAENHKHFFLTAHERIEFNKPEKIGDPPTIRSTKPGFTGQTFPDSIPGMFDLVWHLESIGSGDLIQYIARTQGGSALVAKTCYNGIFKIQEGNPNILDIIKRIKENK